MASSFRSQRRSFPDLVLSAWYWEVDRKYPGNARANPSRAYRLRGPLSGERLEEALQTLLERHEALRSTFAEIDGAPVQFVDADRESGTACGRPQPGSRKTIAWPPPRHRFHDETQYRFNRRKIGCCGPRCCVSTTTTTCLY